MPSQSSLTAPLLAEKDEERGQVEGEHSPEAPQTRLPAQSCSPELLRKWILLWFQITTNPNYLQSPISRRRSWKWVWPLFNTLGLVSDAAALAAGSGNWSIVCADAVLVLITLLVCVRYTLQLTTVRADLVLGVSLLANYAWCNWQLSLAPDGPVALDTGSLSMIILLFCCLGVHSSIAILTLGVGIVAQIRLGHLWKDVMYIVFELIVSSASAIILEFCIASLYQDLQSKVTCNQHLLDFATDGFGAVKRCSWRLTQVSQKMAETFACSEEELVGRRLNELIDDRDRACVGTFLEDAAQGSTPAALLVTASTKGWQFEVRLMPYKIDHDGAEIGFCMQLVGEMRATETLPPAATSQEKPAVSNAEDGALPQQSSDEEQHQELCSAAPASSTQQQTRMMPRSARPSGTLSLSSWTVSAPSVKNAAAPSKSKKDVRTQWTQTGEPQRRRKRMPPAPLAAATGNLQLATRHLRGGEGRHPRSRQRPASSSGQRCLPDVRIEEGRPVLSRYLATPRSTRGNCLSSLAKSFNITGPGCCSKHVGYMALYDVLKEELMGSCGNLILNSDWQCPDCLSLNKWQEDDDSASDGDSRPGESEQFCMVCGTVVENAVRGTAIPTAFGSSSGVAASDSTVG